MTTYEPANPLIVQSDHTVLVEVDSPRYEAARNELVRFAELVKSPEHIHTYRPHYAPFHLERPRRRYFSR
jgi:DNA excision repair protein ERCC-3